MSPEQLMGQQLDGRSDLYALGMLAYEMLCGQHPYHAHLRQPGEIITAHIKTMPPPPSQTRSDLGIPPLMDQIVTKLVEKPRDKRYQDASELQSDLRQIVEGKTGAPTVSAGPMLSVPPGTKPIEIETPINAAPPTTAIPAAKPGAPNNKWMIIAGVVLVALIIGLAIMLFSGKAGAAEPPPPPARLVPSSYSAVLSVDYPKLRAEAPKSMEALAEATRPFLGELGMDLARFGGFAVGAGPSPERLMWVLDAPLDGKKFERHIAREHRDASAAGDKPRKADRDAAGRMMTWRGVRYRRMPDASWALLPPARLLVATDDGMHEAIDLVKGKSKSLVEGVASTLLAQVGYGRQPAPAIWGWARFDGKIKEEVLARFPSAAPVEELAGAMALGPGGADLRAVARCASTDGARQAADASRAALERAKKHPMTSLLGLAELTDATKVQADGALLSLSVHLSREQLGDLLGRLAGMIASAAAQARESSAPPARK
jgi:hypothetical protein